MRSLEGQDRNSEEIFFQNHLPPANRSQATDVMNGRWSREFSSGLTANGFKIILNVNMIHFTNTSQGFFHPVRQGFFTLSFTVFSPFSILYYCK
jgi:hypothetical protein